MLKCMNCKHNLDKLCDIYGCHDYSKFNPITNAEKIKKMADEELAKFLIKVINDSYTVPCMVGDKTCKWEDYPGGKKGCKDCFAEWLRSPVNL